MRGLYTAVREHHRMPVAGSTASPFYPSAGACVGRGELLFSCYWVPLGCRLSAYTGVRTSYSPRVEGLAPNTFSSVACVC